MRRVSIPPFPPTSTVMACATSLMATLQAASLIAWGGGLHLALVGGAERMNHVPIALKYKAAERLGRVFAKSPADALELLSKLVPADFNLPVSGWANRVSGRTMGEHMEDTARELDIFRAEQDTCPFE